MSKTFSKKKSGGKSAGRYSKKRSAGKVAKKSSTVRSSGLKAMVASEVAKVLSSGQQNEKRKLTMELTLDQREVFINGKKAFNTCVRIPITEAIPTMGGSGDGADIRRRRANKIVVTGVNVRASFSVSDQTRIMLLPYEPHETVRAVLKQVPMVTVPDARSGSVPEAFHTSKVPYQMVGLVSKHGPLMTKKFGSECTLDSVDGTPFECRVSTHAGKPIGPVVRKKMGGGALRRTLNWNQKGNASIGAGYTSWDVFTMNEFWKMNKVYTYMYEGTTDQVFERNAEMLMYVDCPSLESMDIKEENPLVGAFIRNVVVDVYFHDM